MSSRAARAAADRLRSTPLEIRLRDLVEQQAALRELAIAVAEMRAPEVIYELVAKQAADVAGVDAGAVVRFRVDGVGEVVGSWRMGSRHTGSLIPLDGAAGVAVVARTGRAARMSAAEELAAREPGTLAPGASVSLPGGVAVPIRVGRELWGSLLVVARTEEWVPPDLEERLSTFAELVGLAITNTDTSARLLSQATSDPLTGLLNHRAFQERVESEVGRAQRYKRPLTLVLLDLDFFKSINDAYGHQAGDTALMHAAGILERCARAGDVLGRSAATSSRCCSPRRTPSQALPIAERWAARAARGPGRRRGAPDDVRGCLRPDARERQPGALSACGRSAVRGEEPRPRHDRRLLARDGRSSSRTATGSTGWSGCSRSRRFARSRESVDSRDSPDGEHSERVGKMVRRLAEASGWTPARVALLGEAAEIHDVGKICVPHRGAEKAGSADCPRVRAREGACGRRRRDGTRCVERGTGGLDRPASRALRRHRLSQPAGERADRRQAPICSRWPTAGTR